MSDAHWHNYAPIVNTVTFDGKAVGPGIKTLHIGANIDDNENYPESRIVLAVRGLFELSMTPEQSRDLRAQLELAERDVVAAVPSLKPTVSADEDDHAPLGLTYAECEQAAWNHGIDLKCGLCASVFYTGMGVPSGNHDQGCRTKTR
jgi:hypothetical protein